MAKKKAAKKKAAKKKPAKTKTAKKTAKKTARKITYKCNNGCKPSKKFKHMSHGDPVTLLAKGTDAHITFKKRGSPFKSHTPKIDLLNGVPVLEVVADGASGEYEYTVDCDGCPSSVGNPKMIVP